MLDMSTFQNVYDCLSFLHRNFFNLKVKSKPQNDDGSGDADTEGIYDGGIYVETIYFQLMVAQFIDLIYINLNALAEFK